MKVQCRALIWVTTWTAIQGMGYQTYMRVKRRCRLVAGESGFCWRHAVKRIGEVEAETREEFRAQGLNRWELGEVE